MKFRNFSIIVGICLWLAGCSQINKLSDEYGIGYKTEQVHRYAGTDLENVRTKTVTVAQSLGYQATVIQQDLIKLTKQASIGATSARDVVSMGFFGHGVDQKQTVNGIVQFALLESDQTRVTLAFAKNARESSGHFSKLFFAKLDQALYLKSKQEAVTTATKK